MKAFGCFSLVLVFLVGFFFNSATWGCSAAREIVKDVAPIADPLLRAIGFCRSHPAARDDALEAIQLAEKGDRLGAALRVALASTPDVDARGLLFRNHRRSRETGYRACLSASFHERR